MAKKATGKGRPKAYEKKLKIDGSFDDVIGASVSGSTGKKGVVKPKPSKKK